MRVSVIITTCGRNTLDKSIESVKKQTFKDYELIVVVDTARKGGAWALNQGINKAKGDYIAILDDDDCWISKDKLKRQVEFLDENLDYIACGSQPQIGQGKEIKANLIGTPFAHISLMFRKGMMYNENLQRAKDVDFFIRLSQRGKLKVLKDCKVSFHISNDLDKKIEDCKWQRKVCLLHKELPNWLKVYLILWKRELKLRRYKLTNALRRVIGSGGK
jgi:glycosyltransferase involved in cell wall biosynthesis